MKKTSALYGVAFLSATNLLLQMLGFLYRVMLSRIAGAETMGMFSLLMPVYSFLMACLLPGLSVAVSAMSARAWTLGRNEELKMAVAASRKLFFIGYGILCICIFPLSEWIAIRFLGDAALKKSLQILLFCFLFSGAESTGKAALMAAKKIERPFLAELTEQSVRFLSVYLFLKNASGGVSAVEAVVRGMAVSELAGGAVLHFLYHDAFPGKKKKETKNVYQELLCTAVPVNASGIASSFLQTFISTWLPTGLMLFGMSRKEALGEIGAACAMAASVTMFPSVFASAVGNVLMQQLAKAMTENKCRDIQRKFIRAFDAVTHLATVSLVVFCIFGEDLCRMIYQNERAAAYIPIFACVAVVSYYSVVLHYAENGLGLQVKSAVSNFTAMLLTLAVDLWLVPRWGMYGYIFGMLTGEIYCFSECLYRICKRTSLHLRDFLRLRSILSGAGMWVLLRQWESIANKNSWLWLCIGVILGLVFYVFLVGMFEKEDKRKYFSCILTNKFHRIA